MAADRLRLLIDTREKGTEMYNTWTAGPLPVGASWIENASGYAYATRTYQEARELAARWNATAHGREWYQPFRGRRDG